MDPSLSLAAKGQKASKNVLPVCQLAKSFMKQRADFIETFRK